MSQSTIHETHMIQQTPCIDHKANNTAAAAAAILFGGVTVLLTGVLRPRG